MARCYSMHAAAATAILILVLAVYMHECMCANKHVSMCICMHTSSVHQSCVWILMCMDTHVYGCIQLV